MGKGEVLLGEREFAAWVERSEVAVSAVSCRVGKGGGGEHAVGLAHVICSNGSHHALRDGEGSS
jgi:hypothetical protein